jgi:hypothetical protein
MRSYNAILEKATGELFLSIQVPSEHGTHVLVVTVMQDAAGATYGEGCVVHSRHPRQRVIVRF